MAGQPEEDPLLELRDSLDEGDEPLFAPPDPKRAPSTATPAKGFTPASGRPQVTSRYGAAAPVAASSAPPPLPSGRRQVPTTGPSPTAIRPSVHRPPPPGIDPFPLPAVVGRPASGQDPFQEPPEPRLPAGGDPEEKLKTFRTILKQKEETLARARSLYQAVDEEAGALRTLAQKLKVELEAALAEAARGQEYPLKIQSLKDMLEKDTLRADDAEKQINSLVAQLVEGEAERKDLSQGLAEVESQFTQATHQLDNERRTREALAEELIGAKEALATAQDRIADLGARASEAQGTLEATTEQLTVVSQELEQAQLELETSRQDTAASAELRSELDAMIARASELGEKLAEAEGKVTALEGEQEWSKSSLDQAQARVTELEEKTADDAALVDELTRQVNSLIAQGEAAEADKSEALGGAAQLDGQLNQTRQRLEQTTAELERHRAVVANHQSELAKARADSEAASVKKLRVELNQANQRAMESGAGLRKEKELREATEARANGATAKIAELTQLLQAAQQNAAAAEVRASRATKSGSTGSSVKNKLKAVEEQLRATQTIKLVVEKELAALKSGTAGGSTGEIEKLRADLAVMKKKMATAESAIEAAASLKAKVARLENQLKAK